MGCLSYFDTWCGLSANLECRSEMCCTRLAGNTGRKKSPFWHHCTTLSGYIFATKAHIDNRKKNLLSSNMSFRRPHNMVNIGPLTAEIGPVVCGTPANFNGFHVLAALLHGSQVVSVSHTAALNRGRHLCSAGRPSHWALAHISSFVMYVRWTGSVHIINVNLTLFRYGCACLEGTTMMQSIHGHTLTVLQSLNVSI